MVYLKSLKCSLEKVLGWQGIKKGNTEIPIKPLSLTIFIIFDPQILVKRPSNLEVCILATQNKYPMLFHSILKQACLCLCSHWAWGRKKKKKSKGQFLSHSNVLLPPCGSVLHGYFSKFDLFSYCLNHWWKQDWLGEELCDLPKTEVCDTGLLQHANQESDMNGATE